MKLNKYDEALSDFNRLLEMEPDNAYILINRGITYRMLHKYDKSLSDLNRSLKIEPNNADALRNRGITYRTMNKYDASLSDLDRSLEIEPKNASALGERGVICRMLGKLEESLENLDRAKKIEADNAFILWNRGITDKMLNGDNKSTKTEIGRIMPNFIPYIQFKNITYLTEGGYGVIFKAIWVKDSEEVEVILKYTNDTKDSTGKLVKEIVPFEITSSDFILQYYGITGSSILKNLIMVMEYAEHGSLKQYLSSNFKEITWKEKLEKLRQIATGIDQIHNKKLIHCDIHSGNILIGAKGIRITDFGLCRTTQDFSYTKIAGIVPYMAPEIIKKHPFTQASDVYSFGMVMWEFTSGHCPFENRTQKLIELIAKDIVRGSRPEITKDTPSVFASLVKKCWDSNQHDRPHMSDIKQQFENWINDKEDEEDFEIAEKRRKDIMENRLQWDDDLSCPETCTADMDQNSIDYDDMLRED